MNDIADEDGSKAETPIAIYYYHPDHLGSNTFITDISGNPYQLFLNLPFGESMAEQSSLGYFQSPYKFNGKELDKETGLYYYGARFYDPRVSSWLSVDPLAEKYPYQSNYVYCSNNPIMIIDPDGRDEWEFNNKGEVINRIPNTRLDAFHFKGKTIEFDYGTIKQQPSRSGHTSNKTPLTFDIFEVKGNNNTKEAFMFLANACEGNVEWGAAYTSTGGKETGYLTTTHDKIDAGLPTMFETDLFDVDNYIGGDHSHENNGVTPSGGDVKYADQVSKKFPNAQFHLYTPVDGAFIPYDRNSDPHALPAGPPIIGQGRPRVLPIQPKPEPAILKKR